MFIEAYPILLPTLIVEIVNEPASEIKTAESISISFGSCETLIVKSVKEQFKLEIETETDGLNSRQVTETVTESLQTFPL